MFSIFFVFGCFEENGQSKHHSSKCSPILFCLWPRGPVHLEVGFMSCCSFWPPPETGMPWSLQTRPSLFARPFPSACLAPPFYVLFSFIWFLPLRPPQVACWAVTDEARFSKGTDKRTFFSASDCSCSQRRRTHPLSLPPGG